MEININEKKYSVEECFEIIGIDVNATKINENKVFDENGNYSFSTDLNLDEPNTTFNLGIMSINK